ncbi:MAG: SH3 domain-containing protein [Myxococcales bacterium]|nr:SH3 domain-containing protein [Myxococcales bacterium]
MPAARRMLLGLGLALGCGGSASSTDSASPPATPAIEEPSAPPAAQCPADPIDVTVAPGTRPEHRDVEFWLAKLPPEAADAVLVPPSDVSALNARFTEVEGAWHDPFDPALADGEGNAGKIDERLVWMGERVDDGRLLEGTPGDFGAAREIARTAEPVDALHMVVEEAPLWCAALDTGLYKPPVDRDFDRNRCASLHPGEVVRVLRRSPDGAWLYAHAGHTTGWLHAPALTPALPPEHLRPLLDGPALRPTDDDLRTEGGRRLRLGTVVPVVGHEGDARRVLVPTAEGLVPDRVRPDGQAVEGVLPLTRRNLWSLALAEQDTPYGWGGREGHRDCSRLVRDVMSTFGLQLARHSGVQAKLGTERIDVSTLGEAGKLAQLRVAAQRGLVLLYMPGHIMIYLGEDRGQHYAVSAISEYLEPCAGGPDTVYRIGRVAVTTLELGRGSERTAYIERLATLVVFGPGGSGPAQGSGAGTAGSEAVVGPT